MIDIEIVLYFLLGWLNGFLFAYIMWAPVTPFYRAFVDGLSLKWIWGRFVK